MVPRTQAVLSDSDPGHTHSTPALKSECPFAVFSLFPPCSRQFQVSGAVVDVAVLTSVVPVLGWQGEEEL